jgi:hypothetical protein
MRIDLKSATGGTRRGESVRPAPKARAFSAKGATFNTSPPQDGFAVANLGQRPRIRQTPSFSAEGATHSRRHAHADESRFQRSCIWGASIPGAVPQAKSEIAPLALHTGQNVSEAGRTGRPPLPRLRRAGRPTFQR